MNCSAEDVAGITRELKISSIELAALAKKRPAGADSLQKLLIALGVDPHEPAHDDPVVMRDLQRLCITCGYKRQRELDLAEATSAARSTNFARIHLRLMHCSRESSSADARPAKHF